MKTDVPLREMSISDLNTYCKLHAKKIVVKHGELVGIFSD